MVVTTLDCVKAAAKALADKKGVNIIAIDLREQSSVTDFILVATGGVDRHVIALAREVIAQLREEYDMKPYHDEGMSEGSWVALDYVDFMVHVMTPDLREFYRIENVWPDAKVVDLPS